MSTERMRNYLRQLEAGEYSRIRKEQTEMDELRIPQEVNGFQVIAAVVIEQDEDEHGNPTMECAIVVRRTADYDHARFVCWRVFHSQARTVAFNGYYCAERDEALRDMMARVGISYDRSGIVAPKL